MHEHKRLAVLALFSRLLLLLLAKVILNDRLGQQIGGEVTKLAAVDRDGVFIADPGGTAQRINLLQSQDGCRLLARVVRL